MKNALSILKTAVVWIVVLAAVAMMVFTIVSVRTFDRPDRNFLGYKAFIVLSDSMSATDFSAGDLVLVKAVDPYTLQPGDIIAFSSQNTENFGEVVTHKIRSVTTDANGDPAFITYGTTTEVDDESLVTFPFIIGKYQSKLAGVGKFFRFLKTVPGYICCILIPFVLLIVIQLVNFIRIFRQYKREQMEDLDRERNELAEERRQSEQMMKELQELKAQLARQSAASAEPAAEPKTDAESKE